MKKIINSPLKMTRSAFTFIELTLVILILGIVSSIGSSVIVNLYQNYIFQRATHHASLKTELAAQQIANLLSYRIPGTILARDPNNLGDYLLVSEVDPTLGGDEDNIHTALEWVGADNDGFTAARIAGWNGFCDLGSSNQNQIITPGSNLNLERNIISNLSGGKVNFNTTGTPNAAIFFRDFLYTKNPDKAYDVKSCMGLVSADTSCISTVRRSPGGTANRNQTMYFVTGAASQKVITEHYKLAWTAYAIIPFRPGTNTPCTQGESNCDLRLYYNYQPWDGERLTAARYTTIPHATIVSNVSVFKFALLGSTMRFKLCTQENIGEDKNVTICKEKAIIL